MSATPWGDLKQLFEASTLQNGSFILLKKQNYWWISLR